MIVVDFHGVALDNKPAARLFLDLKEESNLTRGDLIDWVLLQNGTSSVFQRGDIVLKISDSSFPDSRYEIGRTECLTLKHLEVHARKPSHFPRCLHSNKLWYEGKQRYATWISFESGELFDHAVKQANATQLYKIVESLLSALETMSELGITHRDIDRRNVLVDDSGCVKIIDFALSTSAFAPAQGATLNHLGGISPQMSIFAAMTIYTRQVLC